MLSVRHTPLLLPLLQLLLLSPSSRGAACPEVTRPTLYGDVTLVCSGRGECINGKCDCQDGAQGAEAKRPGWRDLWWQVQPSNIIAPRSDDCGGTIRAHAPPNLILRHWVLLFFSYLLLFASCGWLFGPALPCGQAAVLAEFLPPPPRIWRFTDEPWLLPVATGLSGLGTLAATIISSLFAGALCDCYWPADFDRYLTISAFAEHAPMTVITPLGVLLTSFFATGQVFAAVKHASQLPCYGSCLAKAALGMWCVVCLQVGFWGIGVNVFFNESWDHDLHIELSLYYFVAAGFNNVPCSCARLIALTGFANWYTMQLR